MLNAKTARESEISFPLKHHDIPTCDFRLYRGTLAASCAPSARRSWRNFPDRRRQEIRRLYRDPLYTTVFDI